MLGRRVAENQRVAVLIVDADLAAEWSMCQLATD